MSFVFVQDRCQFFVHLFVVSKQASISESLP